MSAQKTEGQGKKLDNLAAQKKKLLEELQKIEAQEKQELQAEAESAHANIVSLLSDFADYFDARQKNEIARFVGGASRPGRKAGSSNASAGTRGPVAAKFKLPSGDSWSGRGRTPTTFAEWEKSGEAKKWRDANPGQKWPAA